MIYISVIVPCFNEEANIKHLLDAIYAQSYPINEIEVIIADGFSTDRTREVIQEFKAGHPKIAIQIVDNPRRVIPSGLNRAIEATQGRYIIRLDAHSIPDRDYIQNCVRDLEKGLGDNVGGIWKIQPGATSWVARSIAHAASTPLAAGDARYRIGGTAQAVDTVPFGAFHRRLIDKIGKFDETLLTNEDYEFNVRIRQSGGIVWMDPSIRSIYFARATLKELSQQYWRYGYWKAQMLRRYPKTLRWRQLLPPLLVSGLIGLAVLSLAWQLARWLLAILVILYAVAVILVGIQTGIRHKDVSLIVGVPVAIVTIHFSWGAALLWGLLTKPKVKKTWNLQR